MKNILAVFYVWLLAASAVVASELQGTSDLTPIQLNSEELSGTWSTESLHCGLMSECNRNPFGPIHQHRLECCRRIRVVGQFF